MSNTAANVVRWTPTRINNALRCPKPRGAIGKTHLSINGRVGRASRMELRALCHLAEKADLLAAPVPDDGTWPPAVGWLLVPAPAWLIDALATFGAQLDDLEPDADREPGTDDEPGADDEPDTGADAEPELVRPDSMSLHGLDDAARAPVSDKQRERFLTSSEVTAMDAVKAWLRKRAVKS